MRNYMKQKTYIGIVVSFVMAIIFGMEVYASSHETNINFPKQSLSDPCMLYDSLIFNRGARSTVRTLYRKNLYFHGCNKT